MADPEECAWVDLSVYDDGEVRVSYKFSEESREDLALALRYAADTLDAKEEGEALAIH